ncbi:protein phosphatase 2C domain-containing protein [Nocardioides zeae]|uniref:Protein phosphatase 2C domain-containing protein n=1 Tax=Nocardioides imazamoxiresistens TaxID=3231893 RepID=A0ABU3PUX9_9ACTN|nr:protein phosphatase 2C domain-containing protein [Nocardioides zeae]MDT9593042.1 protein phosphatase 2C domain-containing protein [Nocardioides zeae]
MTTDDPGAGSPRDPRDPRDPQDPQAAPTPDVEDTREVPTITAPPTPPAPESDDDTRPRPRIEVDEASDDLGYTELDPNETTGEVPPVTGRLHLDFSAVSDVGRVRKDNQDSGYAGAHLLAVCDGVGGAARGDVASSTAISQLRRLDAQPGEDLLGHVAGGLLRAHTRIGEIVDEDPSLNGTSTTATVALFDGDRLGIAHVGDSRAYLFRDGEITQLTKDHTFVQSLIDEGRITEEEARTHPHRNLILKALDGVHETDPDLFTVDVADGDRLLLCSDGACGVLDDDRLASILSDGTPDFAAVELVRASLEAGSTDNVTCVVADVTRSSTASIEPLLVGAASDLPRGAGGGAGATGLFRGHRSGDTGELDPVPAEIPPSVGFAVPNDPVDPEAQRYAPLPPRRFLWLRRIFTLLLVVGILAAAGGAVYAWTQQRYFVKADADENVLVYRGFDYSLLGLDLYTPIADSGLDLADVREVDESLADRIENGLEYHDSAADARQDLDDSLAAEDPAEGPTTGSSDREMSPSDAPSAEPTKSDDGAARS